MELLEILQNIFYNFLSALPSVLKAILVLIVGWIIAKIISRIVKTLLDKIGIDKLSDKLNEIEIVSNSNFSIKPSVVLSKLIYYILLLLFGTAAAEALGMEEVSNLIGDIISYIPFLISGLIVLVVGTLLAEFAKNVVRTACTSLGIPSANLIASFVFWFIFLTALVSALTQAQIDTTFITSNLSIILAGGVFAFALGYGLASKDMMSNFLASFYSRSRVKIGDQISIDGVSGKIVAIDKSAITVKSEGKTTIIPLSKLTTENIEIMD